MQGICDGNKCSADYGCFNGGEKEGDPQTAQD